MRFLSSVAFVGKVPREQDNSGAFQVCIPAPNIWSGSYPRETRIFPAIVCVLALQRDVMCCLLRSFPLGYP